MSGGQVRTTYGEETEETEETEEAEDHSCSLCSRKMMKVVRHGWSFNQRGVRARPTGGTETGTGGGQGVRMMRVV
jgi:hypothetical protein